MIEIAELTEQIAKTINNLVSARKPISGSQLAPLVKETVSNWNPSQFGVRNLREFIAKYVPSVEVVSRLGLDVVYAPIGSVQDQPKAAMPVVGSPDFWRVWVSPNSPYLLVVDRANAKLRAINRGDQSIGATEMFLESPSVDVHREIAHAFVSSVPSEQQARLFALLANHEGPVVARMDTRTAQHQPIDSVEYVSTRGLRGSSPEATSRCVSRPSRNRQRLGSDSYPTPSFSTSNPTSICPENPHIK